MTQSELFKALTLVALFLSLCAGLSASAPGPWPEKTCAGGEKLYVDEQMIRDIRSRIDNLPWAAQAYDDLRYRATHPFPKSSFTNGLGMEVMQLKEAALYYRIGGDESALPEVVKGLVGFYKADRPDRPLYDPKRLTSRYFWQDVMRFDLRYLAIYDLIRNHPLLDPYRETLDRRMVEAAEGVKTAVRHIRKDSNTTFWTVAGLASYGFYLGDEEAIDMAVNGPWGFKHVLGTFKEGGRFRPEGGTYCYQYVDNCLLIIAELARRNGYPEDLYRWEHPENGASLLKMAEGMFDLAQPGGEINGRGDHTEQAVDASGGWRPERKKNWSLSDKALFGHPDQHRVSNKAELLYYIFRKPEFAWTISRDSGRRTHCDQFWGMANLVYGVPELGEIKAPDVRSELLPDMGMAFLKSVEGPRYWDEGTLTATLVSGVKQITHNQKDHFSFTLYAFGKYLYNDWYLNWDYLCPRPGRANMTPYSAGVAAHNTVSVDFKSPGPAEGKVQYSGIRREGGSQIISLEGEVFEGVLQKRTLCLTGEYLIDVFTLTSDTSHNYDWFLHSRGTASYEGLRGWKVYGQLNGEYGFGPIDTSATKRPHNEWLLESRAAKAGRKGFSVRFTDTDGITVKTTVFCGKGTVVMDTATPFYVNLGGWDKPIPAGMPERNPMTVVRMQGRDAAFIAVHQPLKERTEELKVTLKGDELTVRGPHFTDTYLVKEERFVRK